MRVGIFGRDNDVLLQHVKKQLEARGAEVWVLELGAMYQGAPFTWDGEGWHFKGLSLSQCEAFFVRKIPAETALLDKPEATGTAESWWRRAMQAKERAHASQSCLSDLQRAGKRVVNPHLHVDPYDQKPLQLATLKRAGIPIPRTLITNSPDAVRKFRDEVGGAIYKPLGGGAETQVLDDNAMKRLDAIASTPVIFQERVNGPDLRATLVGDRIASIVEIPAETVDYRSSATYREGKQQYVPVTLPREVEDQCRQVARLCGQVLSGIDLKRTPEGRYVFIEANSSPVYLGIELATGHPITEALVDHLLGKA
jgi:glutathione synthase/RimK-type ligase-like ATP-grasp enzyme